MKIKDAVQHMTTQYLRRVIDSFTEDIPPKQAEEARGIVVNRAGEPARIKGIKDTSGSICTRGLGA